MKKFALFTLVFLLSYANSVVPAPTEVIAAINEAISLKIPIGVEGVKIYGDEDIRFDPSLIAYGYIAQQLEVKADVLIFSEKERIGTGGIIIIPLNRLKSLEMNTVTKIPYQGKLITESEFDRLSDEQKREVTNGIDTGSIKTITEKTKLMLYFQ
jgi:hypothetical protein